MIAKMRLLMRPRTVQKRESMRQPTSARMGMICTLTETAATAKMEVKVPKMSRKARRRVPAREDQIHLHSTGMSRA
jgi:hypothetical protein